MRVKERERVTKKYINMQGEKLINTLYLYNNMELKCERYIGGKERDGKREIYKDRKRKVKETILVC